MPDSGYSYSMSLECASEFRPRIMLKGRCVGKWEDDLI